MDRSSLRPVNDPPPPFDHALSAAAPATSSPPAGAVASSIRLRKPSISASAAGAGTAAAAAAAVGPPSHQHVALATSTAAMIAAASSTAAAAASPTAAALSLTPGSADCVGSSSSSSSSAPAAPRASTLATAFRPSPHGIKIAPTKSLSAAIAEAAAKHAAAAGGAGARRADDVLQASLLAPRVAVILNVPESWHLPLFVGRLISIVPAILYGWRPALQLLDQMLPGEEGGAGAFPRTETALASMWCFAAGYLSFFFADCLMSRWLINYTPQATIVRLLSINAVNFYVTNITLKLFGAFHDLRLFLPAWIAISAFLTGVYHVTHQKINIRKETITSINVFSIASSISMVSLLLLAYGARPDLPEIPLVVYSRLLFAHFLKLLVRLRASLREQR
ncbi:hypothetical protein BROUX41_001865 [Berkeleyomyces rouxiae]